MGLHTAEPAVWEEGYTRCRSDPCGPDLCSRPWRGGAPLAFDGGHRCRRPFDEIGLRHLGSHRLKGLVWPEEIFQLVIEDLPADFPPLHTLEGAGPATETATVLMTDVEGLTALSRTMQADEFRALIAQYHQRAQAVWHQHEGLGVLAVGDTSVAVFRSPRVAVRAAADLQRTLLTATWPGGTELRVNVALDSGEVLATSHGYFGHAVNRCFSLCATADGGQTLVSEVTRGLLGDTYEGDVGLADLGEREVGGSTIRAYEIVEGAPNAWKHVGHVALEILEDRERHPVDDGRAVQHVDVLEVAFGAVTRAEAPGLVIGRVRDRGGLAVPPV